MGDQRLIRAVREGNLEELRQLLNGGADVEERDEQGWTPLHWAAGQGHTEIVRLLLEHGASISSTGRDLRVPLLIAQAARRQEVVQILTTAAQAQESEDATLAVRPYARAYLLNDLREFPGWPASIAGQQEDTVVYLHQDFTVTRSMLRHRDVIFSQVTPEWIEFCRERLRFAIPADLR